MERAPNLQGRGRRYTGRTPPAYRDVEARRRTRQGSTVSGDAPRSARRAASSRVKGELLEERFGSPRWMRGAFDDVSGQFAETRGYVEFSMRSLREELRS